MSGGAVRTIRPIAEIVNIVDPMPPRPRTISSIGNDVAAAQAAVDRATITRPAR